MKIIRLSAENFKRLSAVEITPTGNLVEIAGKNGQGKSSILDAIWVALAGLGAAPKRPIKSGELESKIVLHLGSNQPEIVVTRTFRPSKDGTEITSALKVESADGAKYSSPQAMLDKLLGSLTFDPLAFDRMDAREQFNALRAFVPGVNFDEIEAAQRGDYDRRTMQNRRAKEARAAADAIKVSPSRERIDEAALVAELEAAGKHNADIETRKANRERYAAEAKLLSSRVEETEGEIAKLLRQIEAIKADIEVKREVARDFNKRATEITERLAAAGDLPALIDTTVLRHRIEKAREHNAASDEAARQEARKAELLKQAREAEETSKALTESIDMREIEKRKAIEAAALPIDGISFGDGEVLLRGVPWSQASDAERLVASMQMAMSMNPKLRVVRVRDGSLLDGDSMKIVADLAAKHDYQVWIERVDGSGRVGVVIEDGRVKSTH